MPSSLQEGPAWGGRLSGFGLRSGAEVGDGEEEADDEEGGPGGEDREK